VPTSLSHSSILLETIYPFHLFVSLDSLVSF
jgi:hypothetical protein